MTEKTVKGKAPWILGEIVPILITTAIGAGAIILGLIGQFNLVGAVSGAVVGFGLTLFLLYVNASRKRKSTLVAELKNDPKYGLKVWMVKPNKNKWKDKMDYAGTNSVNLVGKYKVVVEDVLGTQTLVFQVSKGKQFILPVRFLRDNSILAKYVAEAKNASSWTVSTEADEVFKEYLPVITQNTTVETVLPPEDEEGEEDVAVEDEEGEVAWEEEIYGQYEPEKIEKEYRVTKFITYPDIEEDKPLVEQVDAAIEARERQIIADADKKMNIPTPDLLGFGENNTSITIDLPEVDKK